MAFVLSSDEGEFVFGRSRFNIEKQGPRLKSNFYHLTIDLRGRDVAEIEIINKDSHNATLIR
jgi:hypothetical protein